MSESRSADVLARLGRVLTPNYRPTLVLERGEGAHVYDAEGRRYLDLLAGLAVSSFGHCHPAIVAAVRDQVGKLAHVSNLYATEVSVRLAERLTEMSGFPRAYLCNSGTEAVEAALKLARLHARKARGEDRFEFVAFDRSFHGRTFGSLSCTGQPNYHDGFEPLVPGVSHVPYGDLDAVRQALGPRTAAVIVEAVQGEGGVRPAPEGFLAGLRSACDDAGCLLIVDEIQTGMGRTGRFFAHQHDGIRPDIVTVAKALGGGLPLGALLTSEEVGAVFVPGTHATTFGGNPVVCAAGLAALGLLGDGLIERAASLGSRLTELLEGVQARNPELVREVRGRGLLVGMELTLPARPLVPRALELGVILGVAGDHVLRLAPPLVVDEADLEAGVRVVETVIREVE
jgi:acetylornithine/N-succinyldiaminopimelate aminotransferase